MQKFHMGAAAQATSYLTTHHTLTDPLCELALRVAMVMEHTAQVEEVSRTWDSPGRRTAIGTKVALSTRRW